MRAIAATLMLSSMSMTTLAHATEVARVVRPPMLPVLEDQMVLKNDGFADEGGQAYLQLGFVSGEQAGVWLEVPAAIPYFKVDSFRILYGEANVPEFFAQEFFSMGVADAPSPTMPAYIQNAVEVTSGPYWNDIPAQGANGETLCARGGQFIGAALEFTHDGSPSVYRDLDGLSNIKYNTLMAIPGGWAYSAQYGLRGDWVMRVIGHEASAADCGL